MRVLENPKIFEDLERPSLPFFRVARPLPVKQLLFFGHHLSPLASVAGQRWPGKVEGKIQKNPSIFPFGVAIFLLHSAA